MIGNFPESFSNEFLERNIDRGKAILVKINSFEINHSKFAIIIAKPQKEALPSVIINSKVNENVFPTPYLKSLHIKIDKQNHSFLQRDSFVNCSKIEILNTDNTKKAIRDNPKRVLGNVSDDVMRKIFETVANATTISKAEKLKFGFYGEVL